jgi:alpha-galactosidase
MCECYIEQIKVRSPAHFKFMLRSGMMGWCTVMTDTSKWTKEEHEIARQQFALYKNRLRPLIKSANLYHISDRPDGVHWDAIQYFDPQSAKGALFAFRGTTGEAAHTFKLKGLDPAANYELSFEDGSSKPLTRTGAELTKDGITLHLAEPESSEIILITPK